MPSYKLIDDCNVQVALWQITESEQELMDLVGLDLSNQYSYPRRRMERMAIRALLNYLNHLEPVQYHQNGRPYFTDTEYNISISHAGKFVAVALSKDQNVGVDVENINRNYTSIARKYLSPNELSWINLGHKQSMALSWCIKEAVFKLPWVDFKCFTSDIEIRKFEKLNDHGEVTVEAIDQKSVHSVLLKYLFFDEYCLSWVSH